MHCEQTGRMLKIIPMTDVNKEILDFFFKESADLLQDLIALGTSLKGVGIPNDSEAAILAEFSQKLNRLIGGTASVGFDVFTPLSRKTAMLAERCANIREITIRILIVNLNNVIAHLSECLQNVESIEKGKEKVVEIEKKIDICLAATGINTPEVKTQEEIDSLLDSFGH